MHITYKNLRDTSDVVDAATAFREFYLDYLEEYGEKGLRKAMSVAINTNSHVELGKFKTNDRSYEVLVTGTHIIVEGL